LFSGGIRREAVVDLAATPRSSRWPIVDSVAVAGAGAAADPDAATVTEKKTAAATDAA